jgi:hypothetical protein
VKVHIDWYTSNDFSHKNRIVASYLGVTSLCQSGGGRAF